MQNHKILLYGKQLNGVFAKRVVYAYVEKLSMAITTILLLSVASIRRKWLNTTHTEERSANTIPKVTIFDSDRKYFNLIPNKQIDVRLVAITIEYFST